MEETDKETANAERERDSNARRQKERKGDSQRVIETHSGAATRKKNEGDKKETRKTKTTKKR